MCIIICSRFIGAFVVVCYYFLFHFIYCSIICPVHAELPAPAEDKRLATWGSEVPDDIVLDEKLLAESLKKVKTEQTLDL